MTFAPMRGECGSQAEGKSFHKRLSLTGAVLLSERFRPTAQARVGQAVVGPAYLHERYRDVTNGEFRPGSDRDLIRAS